MFMMEPLKLEMPRERGSHAKLSKNSRRRCTRVLFMFCYARVYLLALCSSLTLLVHLLPQWMAFAVIERQPLCIMADNFAFCAGAQSMTKYKSLYYFEKNLPFSSGQADTKFSKLLNLLSLPKLKLINWNLFQICLMLCASCECVKNNMLLIWGEITT